MAPSTPSRGTSSSPRAGVEGLKPVCSESQAEANRALTRAMESHTNAVEEAIKSQERTSRALAEGLGVGTKR